MPQKPSRQPLRSSVLDRLIDHDPLAAADPPLTERQMVRDLKECIRRDLENLLSTRWYPAGWPAGLHELDVSLVSYGMPDITGTGMVTAEEREQFRRIMEHVIRRFEPRLDKVSVTILNGAKPVERILRFRIEGLLRLEPAPDPVQYDSALEPATGNVAVKGVGP